jgi:hypothetical protein
MRPLWRVLILKLWGGDPLECPGRTGRFYNDFTLASGGKC